MCGNYTCNSFGPQMGKFLVKKSFFLLLFLVASLGYARTASIENFTITHSNLSYQTHVSLLEVLSYPSITPINNYGPQNLLFSEFCDIEPEEEEDNTDSLDYTVINGGILAALFGSSLENAFYCGTGGNSASYSCFAYFFESEKYIVFEDLRI